MGYFNITDCDLEAQERLRFIKIHIIKTLKRNYRPYVWIKKIIK
jgi:hypothetical protein